jgi:hypothetical protein
MIFYTHTHIHTHTHTHTHTQRDGGRYRQKREQMNIIVLMGLSEGTTGGERMLE